MSCWFTHKWGKWKQTGTWVIVSAVHGGDTGFGLKQERVCSVCGKMQIDTQIRSGV